jgi:hypothetical protein
MKLHHLHQLAVQSTVGEPLGWIEDYLFNWHTGEIAAYILTGAIAEALGERAVLWPEDVQATVANTVIVREGTKDRLSRETEGLKGFLSEKSHQVRHLVQVLSDRLHNVISPHDRPNVVHVKIQEVSDELAASGHHDHHALREATEFLHDHWESLQHRIERASSRVQFALNSAWKQLAGQKK